MNQQIILTILKVYLPNISKVSFKKWGNKLKSPNNDEMLSLYWFWKQYKRYNSDKSKSQFDFIYECNKVKIYMNGRYNGQTKAEYHKNFKRVTDIVDKSAGDKDHAIRLAQSQANKITDEWKAVNRAMAAKDMGHEHIFEVFFQKAYELGTVSKQDYREYKLSKLGI